MASLRGTNRPRVPGLVQMPYQPLDSRKSCGLTGRPDLGNSPRVMKFILEPKQAAQAAAPTCTGKVRNAYLARTLFVREPYVYSLRWCATVTGQR